MILRWIQSDARNKKLPVASLATSPGQSPYALVHPSTAKQRQGSDSSSKLGDMGESEFNAILEEVCDTVMPRKSVKKPALHRYKPQDSHKSALTSPHGQDIPWSTLFLKLGEETASSLNEALSQLQDIALLHPNVAPAIASVTDRLDHARRGALIAQQFTQLRGSRDTTPSEEISLRQVVSDAITLRARWLHRRKVKARLGLLDAQIMAKPIALNSLVDELINWAGGISQDIGFAVREPTEQQPGAQLLVIARLNTSRIEPAQWQNIGWYIWHQLAGSMGAKAELQVTQEALSVTVDFAPPAPLSSLTPVGHAGTGTSDSQMDTDIGSIIAGCRVMLLLGNPQVHEQVHRSVSRLGLHVQVCASLAQAKLMLGLELESESHPLPHAIVYDAIIDLSNMLALREQMALHHPAYKMAFVELSEHVGSDFHVSHMGEASTAHVSLQAIATSLAPALVFELCKVI